jgi:hypothetical protein
MTMRPDQREQLDHVKVRIQVIAYQVTNPVERKALNNIADLLGRVIDEPLHGTLMAASLDPFGNGPFD